MDAIKHKMSWRHPIFSEKWTSAPPHHRSFLLHFTLLRQLHRPFSRTVVDCHHRQSTTLPLHELFPLHDSVKDFHVADLGIHHSFVGATVAAMRLLSFSQACPFACKRNAGFGHSDRYSTSTFHHFPLCSTETQTLTISGVAAKRIVDSKWSILLPESVSGISGVWIDRQTGYEIGLRGQP